MNRDPEPPPAAWRYRNVIATGMTSLLADMSYEMANAILPAFLIFLQASPLAVGMIEGVSDGASSLVKSLSGYMSDRFSRRKPFMVVGYLATGILVPSIGLAKNVLTVLALKASAWAGRGIRGPPRDALLADSVPPSIRGRAFGLQRGMDQIGAVVGPLIALVFVSVLGYSDLFFISIIPGIAAFLVVLTVKDVPRRPSLRGGRSSFVESVMGVPMKFRLFLLGTAVFGVANFGNLLFVYRAVQILSPIYGNQAASQMSFGLYALLNGVYSIASYPVGNIGDRWSSRNMLVIGYIVFAVASLAIAVSPASLPLLAGVFAVVGVHMALVDTSEASFAAHLLPEEARGTGYGLLHSVNGVGDLVSSVSVSAIWFAFTPFVGFSYAAALSLAAAVFMFLLTR